MQLSELCRLIDLPAEMTRPVLAFDQTHDPTPLHHLTPRIRQRPNWEAAVKDLQALLGNDPAALKSSPA